MSHGGTLGEVTASRSALLVTPNRPHIRMMQTAINAGAATRPWFGVIEVWEMNRQTKSDPLTLPNTRTIEPWLHGSGSWQAPPKIPGVKELNEPTLFSPTYRNIATG
jgi:hypothetical protein